MNLARRAWLLLAIVAIAGVLPVAARVVRGPEQRDFDAFWTAARMLQAGHSAYETPVQELLGPSALAAPHREYVYPPLFAGLLRPLAMLPYRAASIVWLVANVVFAALLAVALSRLARAGERDRRWIAFAVIVMPATYHTLVEGQVSILIALLLTLGALAFDDAEPARVRGEIGGGVALGLAAAIKVYPIALLVVPAWHRRWRVFGTALVTIGVSFGIGAMLSHGLADTFRLFREVLPAVATRDWPANQGMHAALARLAPGQTAFGVNGVPDSTALLTPLLPSARAASLLATMIVGVLALVSSVVVLRRGVAARGSALADYALAVAFLSLAAPVVWDHYYVQLLVPGVIIWRAARRGAAPPALLWWTSLLILLQRFWRPLVLFAPSGVVLMLGTIGTMVLWSAALRVTARPQTEHG